MPSARRLDSTLESIRVGSYAAQRAGEERLERFEDGDVALGQRRKVGEGGAVPREPSKVEDGDETVHGLAENGRCIARPPASPHAASRR